MSEYLPPYHIICEGKSECAYIQTLKRFLRENEIAVDFALISYDAGGGYYETLEEKYKDVRKKKENDKHFAIWCDADIYIGNRTEKERRNAEAYKNKPQNIPDFMFNHQNFEDFLVMHLPNELFDIWESTCIGHNHCTTPLFADDNNGNPGYLELLKTTKIFSEKYKKGALPEEFVFSDEALQNLIKRHKDTNCFFESDFVNFLCGVLCKDKNS